MISRRALFSLAPTPLAFAVAGPQVPKLDLPDWQYVDTLKCCECDVEISWSQTNIFDRSMWGATVWRGDNAAGVVTPFGVDHLIEQVCEIMDMLRDR